MTSESFARLRHLVPDSHNHPDFCLCGFCFHFKDGTKEMDDSHSPCLKKECPCCTTRLAA
jgi:hypothetical protein